MNIQDLDHIALSVSDLEKSIHWYQDVLGLEHLYQGAWGGIPVMLFVGNTGLALFPADDKASEVPNPPAIRVLHVAFRTDYEGFIEAQEKLAQFDIQFSFQDHEISHSIYFYDPDGHQLEITTYDLDGHI